ncbi:MAG: DUF3179 domain-containing protein [candidate division Zixibacteria bacterium]|nr:DUF3179 domain-containing protein [candidate division Zixibacteria bacterium]
MRTLISIILTMLITGTFVIAQDREVKKETLAGHTLYTVLEKGDIPAVYNPEFYTAEDADEFYFADEPLMIVSKDGVSHAYSTWHLDHHEIVNDRIENISFAATW